MVGSEIHRGVGQGSLAPLAGSLLLALCLASLAPSAGVAQQAPPRAEGSIAPGWVGFQYHVSRAPGSAPLVVVERVDAGSPAASAGLRPGDRIVAVGGVAPSASAFRSIGRDLVAGERLRIVLSRDGHRHEVVVAAAPRPRALAASLERAADRSRALLADLDSLRVHVLLRAARVDAHRPPAAPRAPIVTPSHVSWSASASEPSSASGANTIVFERLAADSPTAQPFSRFVWTMTGDPRGSGAPSAAVTAERAVTSARVSRPLAAYLVGQDRAAGARFTPLNEGLGAYFGASRGLLVVEISEGTPAAAAGLRPGDVLLSLAGRTLAGMGDLRRSLASAPQRPLPLSVLRQGRTFKAWMP